jgi:folate-binding Fe-S cluster repair protein YgfZ
MLQGLFSNDIVALAPSGCYATYLTPQGRMIADVWVHELGDVILRTELAQRHAFSRLDKFIFPRTCNSAT